MQRQRGALAGELGQVRPQQVGDVDVFEWRRASLAGDDAHHLLGRHAVGAKGGDEGTRRGADVDVEVVDGAVDRQQVQGAQGADLIDAPGEAAAAEHEGGLVAPAPAPALDRGGPADAPRGMRRPRAAAAAAFFWVGSSLTTLPITNIVRARGQEPSRASY